MRASQPLFAASHAPFFSVRLVAKMYLITLLRPSCLKCRLTPCFSRRRAPEVEESAMVKTGARGIPVEEPPGLEAAHSAPLFSFDGVCGKAVVTSCYDGDSFDIAMTLYGSPLKLKTRLHGLDTPELRTKNLLEKQLAYVARDRVRALCQDRVVNVSLMHFEKYGRTMVKVELEDGKDLTQLLIDEKLAVPYDGKTKVVDWDDFIAQNHPKLEPYHS